MPTNLLIPYNQLLEMLRPSQAQNEASIREVFNRDFVNGAQIVFRTLPILPRPAQDMAPIDQLFWHLTTVEVDPATKKRAFESDRSVRIHWIRHHLVNNVNNTVYFTVTDENRVYILDKTERYVVVLDPSRVANAYYLLTAYKLGDSNYKKIMKKLERRGQPL